jgi:hypothetical protein
MKRHRRVSAWLAGATLACALMLAADAASAAVWEWGCMGTLGNEQIIFNRNRLIVISGKAPPGKLDDFVHGDRFATEAEHSATAIAIVATYQPNASNDGLATTLGFTGEAADRKLTLTELSSRRIGHSARLIAHCRDETIDRFRKSYRVERPRAATYRNARVHGVPAFDQGRPHLPLTARAMPYGNVTEGVSVDRGGQDALLMRRSGHRSERCRIAMAIGGADLRSQDASDRRFDATQSSLVPLIMRPYYVTTLTAAAVPHKHQCVRPCDLRIPQV